MWQKYDEKGCTYTVSWLKNMNNQVVSTVINIIILSKPCI